MLGSPWAGAVVGSVVGPLGPLWGRWLGGGRWVAAGAAREVAPAGRVRRLRPGRAAAATWAAREGEEAAGGRGPKGRVVPG